LGAAFAGGLAVRYWKGPDELKNLWEEDKIFTPELDFKEVIGKIDSWKKAVDRIKKWA